MRAATTKMIPALADAYRVIAPDLPGFGFSDAPDRAEFSYTFENLTSVIDRFTDAIWLGQYALFVFDYGAPGAETAKSSQDQSVRPEPPRRTENSIVLRLPCAMMLP